MDRSHIAHVFQDTKLLDPRGRPSLHAMRFRAYRTFCFGSLCIATLLASEMPAIAESADHTGEHVDHFAKAKRNVAKIMAKKPTTHRFLKPYKASVVAAAVDSKAIVAAAPPKDSLARLNERYGVKGWNIPYPSYQDSLLQDEGGWRSALASVGFGVSAYDIAIFSNNMLNTPNQVPGNFPPCTSRYSQATGALCAGNQTYFGQRPSYINTPVVAVTYDLSRWGVPDGQLIVAGQHSITNDIAFMPYLFQVAELAWYQTLLDKKVEIKFGYVGNTHEFISTFIGGNFASTFGPSAAIPVQLGLSIAPTPSFRGTWHVTDTVYIESAVQRSTAINSVTGNVVFDEALTNPTGLNWNGPNGTRALFITELGYKREASPGAPKTWLRLDFLYNNSTFKDFSQLATNPGATRDGNYGVTFLGDRQLWQQDPSSPFTAYRGIYAGVSLMYAPPETTAISQYYEGRAYWIGPLDSRPTDMASIVYARNVVSHYLPDVTNPFASMTGAYAARTTNAITASYTAHLRPGLWGTLGVSYTDHPSVAYFKTQGSSLNFLASLVMNM
ncbi:porin [Bradyrhizobium elkanii]|uniref:carbohydrate porin n=1 Tax=Bradyrhizobium elkanii TaxID=29448 RepID=UPI0035193A40